MWDLTVIGIADILPRSLETFSVLSSPLAIGPLVDRVLQRRRECSQLRKMVILTAATDELAFKECMVDLYRRLQRKGILLSCEEARLHP